MDIKILVATHKKYWMPNDDVYLPLHVGMEGKEDLGYLGDNTGDNISTKNANYCELTGLYWAWKNLKCDYIGLCHYRRYFGNIEFVKNILIKNRFNKKINYIYSKKDYETLLNKYDIILPQKLYFYKYDIYKCYEIGHNIKDLNRCYDIICEQFPEYKEAFEITMHKNSLYAYNMFATKKHLFDEYMQWLFNILFTLEKRIDISNYDSYQKRVYGFLSERLFNVWIEKNKDRLKIKETTVIFLEKINLITMLKEEIKRFLKL